MNKQKIFIIILFMIVVLILGLFIDCNMSNTSCEISIKPINEISLNVAELSVSNTIVQNATNELIVESIIEENEENKNTLPNTPITNNNKEQQSSSKTIAKSTTDDNVKNKNDTSKSNAQNKEVSKNVSNKNTATTSVKTDTSNKQATKEEKIEHPELANKTYTKQNTSVVPEIINILNDEISKDKELVDFGTKAVAGTKANAYKNTTGFTYMFVSDIQKGKVKGNYITFPQRVKNNVGAFGTYYVYAEDEYTYNSSGTNPKWSQTLVWIWVSF